MRTDTRFPRLSGLRRTRGFTLIEAVMVIVLLGILAAAGAPMIAEGMRVATTASTDLDTLSQLRYTTERLARELREIESVGGVYTINTGTGTFTKTDGTVVTISFASPNVSINYAGTGSATLTNQASAFQLNYLDISGATGATASTLRFVEVQLTLTNPTTGASHTQRTRVAMRNTG